MVKLAETLRVGVPSAACYVEELKSIVWAGGFASDRVTSYNLASRKWAFRGVGRYDSLVCSDDDDDLCLPRLPASRHSCGIASLRKIPSGDRAFGNIVYLFSGIAGSSGNDLGTGFQLNLSSHEWTSFPCLVLGACTAYPWDSDRFVVIPRTDFCQSFYVFDTSDSNTHSPWSTIPAPKPQLTTLYSLHGKLYATIGTRFTDSIIVSFDEPSQTWTPIVPPTITPTTALSAESLVDVHSLVVIE